MPLSHNSRKITLSLSLAALPVAGLMLCAASASAPPKKAAKKTPVKTASAAVPAANSAAFERDVSQFVQKYCVGCHSGPEPAAGLPISGYKSLAVLSKDRSVWERIANNVESRHMPPEEAKQPTKAERDRLVSFVQSYLSKADCDVKDPGRVTLHRLNRTEYNNTVRDLVGLDLHPADAFPADDVGYGFDNIGDVLSISPLLMEKYVAAAGRISRAVIAAPEDKTVVRLPMNVPLAGLGGSKTFAAPQGGAGRLIRATEETGADLNFPAGGEYNLRFSALGIVPPEAMNVPGTPSARVTVKLDGRPIKGQVFVQAAEKGYGTYNVGFTINQPGPHHISLTALSGEFRNMPRRKKDGTLITDKPVLPPGEYNVAVQSLDITPVGADAGAAPPVPVSPAIQARIIRYKPVADTDDAKDAATKQNMAEFAARAYRRPLTGSELERLALIAQRARANGGSFERGMQIAVQASLVSPNFLFRVEKDPDPNNPRATHPLNDYELANRLSYFLWSSMPDARLLSLASQNKLRNPVVLKAEAARMLRDPRSKALADNFAAQWLNLRKLSIVSPDPQKFTDWNDELRNAMRTETEMFFQSIVTEDKSVLNFLDSDYTYLNEPLAKHYGNTSVKGPDFRLVKLTGGNRGGVLTQASVLTVTSNATRTSPVKRGKWVMENILGSEIPPPPPNVPELADDKKGPLTGTLRQRLEAHRANPACASCHARMDPIGFGLENFDAVGKWRTMDGEFAIDSSGAMPGGKAFRGPQGLKGYLKTKSPEFVRNLSEKLMTYALGRGIEPYDRCNMDAIAQNVTKNDYKFSALVNAIITSEPFRSRRGDGVSKEAKL